MEVLVTHSGTPTISAATRVQTGYGENLGDRYFFATTADWVTELPGVDYPGDNCVNVIASEKKD